MNPYSTGWLKRGFPWVYPAEIVQGRAAAGQVVQLAGEGGAALGTGIADSGWIAVRRFRRTAGALDGAFFRERIADCHRARAPVFRSSDAWRLVHGENDDLPGIRMDVWGDELVLTLDSPSLVGVVDLLVDAATEVAGPFAAVWLAERRDPRDAERRLAPVRRIRGERADAARVVTELGLRYEVHPSLGKDAGLFCDMRENRAWLAPHWRGARVLNLFAHTGAFSVSARANGAAEVASVDLSEGYLERARRNFELNDLDPGELVPEDCFRALDRFRRQGRRFDRVLVDPPGFSHSEAGTWQGEKEWARLAAACLRVIEPGGWLIAASNLGSQSPKQFGGALESGAERAERSLRLLHEGTPPPDFPAALHFPEGRYLKFWVMEVR